ncbi:MAG TPA: thioredoxin family protein [Chitinophagales bacterium]|nr:thioredoxin family protein [Chitinophagales bacterium]
MQKVLITLFAIISICFTTQAHHGYHVGDNIADFSLKNIDGKNVSLANYTKAKGFIIVFTCNHCPYAKAYEDRIIALDKKYAALGYPVIAINPNDAVQYPEDDYASMQQRAKEKGFTFPYLHDETQAVTKTFGAIKTPHIFIVKRENTNLNLKYVGTIDDNWEDASAVTETFVVNAVDELLADKPVSVANTKAVGCSIKWKKP